jgi:hypothetical protein
MVVSLAVSRRQLNVELVQGRPNRTVSIVGIHFRFRFPSVTNPTSPDARLVDASEVFDGRPLFPNSSASITFSCSQTDVTFRLDAGPQTIELLSPGGATATTTRLLNGLVVELFSGDRRTDVRVDVG